MYYMDYTYLIYVMPAIILSMIAQFLVKNRFERYSRIRSNRNLTGREAADMILKQNGIYDVKIVNISGSLSDNYNPATKVLSLSTSTYDNSSVAAIGVAAHEAGHAIQHAKRYKPLVLRKLLVPVANFGSRLGPILVILGLIFTGSARAEATYSPLQYLTDLGIILFAGSVLFYIVTLPVEFNASRRALSILKNSGTLDSVELDGARKVLTAAALTYVASALTAIGSLLRLLVLTGRSRRR